MLYVFVFNLMTDKLCDHAISTYNEICSIQQDRINHPKLDLDVIFVISCNVINALKFF